MGKTAIRAGVFETNSSSTHCITVCMEEDYKNWTEGKGGINLITGEYTPLDFSEEFKRMAEANYNSQNKEYLINWKDLTDTGKKQWYATFARMCDEDEMEGMMPEATMYNQYEEENSEMDHFLHRFTTPGGENVVAFGYYGYD